MALATIYRDYGWSTETTYNVRIYGTNLPTCDVLVPDPEENTCPIKEVADPPYLSGTLAEVEPGYAGNEIAHEEVSVGHYHIDFD